MTDIKNAPYRFPQRGNLSRWLRALIVLAALCVFSGLAYGAATKPVVYIAGSGNAALDKHISRLLSEALGDEAELEFATNDQLAVMKTGTVVTIGPVAFSKVRQANRDLPILAMLVERTFIEDYTDHNPGQISAIYFDVPLILQALTGKAILPHANKIALLATPDTVHLYEHLIDQLPDFGMDARVFVVDNSEQLIPTLVRALTYGDFLLAGPDSAIYNPRTIKHLLLTAYRRNRIVIGPSQAYVKAGALASKYAPYPQMAEMAAQYLIQHLTSGRFPTAAYPTEFGVELNLQVARSLNIPLPERQAIADYVRQQMERAGRKPE